MKKLFLAALFLTLQLTHAQYDYGIETRRDEFTREYTCAQRVDNSTSDDTGVMMMYADSFGYGFVIIRDFKNDPNTWVFNSLNLGAAREDYVYIRFQDGEIFSGTPAFTSVETSPQRVDAAGFYAEETLITKLLTVSEDVRVRFVGMHGTRDFTIKKEVFYQLAKGFGTQCLGIYRNNSQGG